MISSNLCVSSIEKIPAYDQAILEGLKKCDSDSRAQGRVIPFGIETLDGNIYRIITVISEGEFIEVFTMLMAAASLDVRPKGSHPDLDLVFFPPR
jgi:hypothetical protein